MALELAIKYGIKNKILNVNSVQQIITDSIAAISVGIYNELPCLDLCYIEDSVAQTDMNVVMTGKGNIVEIQGTAEKSF